MGSLKVLCLLLISFKFSYSYHQNEESLIPALTWDFKNTGDYGLSSNSLHNYETSSFTSRLEKIIKHSSSPLVLCFVTPILNVEDFSVKPSSFKNLQNEISNSKFVDYLSSVNNPVEGVKNLENDGFIVKEINIKDTSAQGIETLLKHLENIDVAIIKLKEENDVDRSKLLEQYDRFITQTYKTVFEQRKNVIGILTGEMSTVGTISSLIRYRRAVGDSNETSSVLETNKYYFQETGPNGRTLLFTKKPMFVEIGSENFTLVKNDRTDVMLDDRKDFQRFILRFNVNGKTVTTRLIFNRPQQISSKDRWSLKTIEYLNGMEGSWNLTTDTTISAFIGKSFSTTKPIVFSDKAAGVKLTFEAGLQVQPFDTSIGRTEGFAAAENAIPFFTPGIWMGIFVMSLLAFIFTLGITMIMDIKTMDRFDDAKGKTITINVVD